MVERQRKVKGTKNGLREKETSRSPIESGSAKGMAMDGYIQEFGEVLSTHAAFNKEMKRRGYDADNNENYPFPPNTDPVRFKFAEGVECTVSYTLGMPVEQHPTQNRDLFISLFYNGSGKADVLMLSSVYLPQQSQFRTGFAGFKGRSSQNFLGYEATVTKLPTLLRRFKRIGKGN